jgi:hypothetical protein
LPSAETIYTINLKTRSIDGPAFLSIAKDHDAVNIYFSVPRYVDFMDLAQTACIIQYKKPNGKMGIYPVPFYDIYSHNEYGNEKLIFSWLLNENATAESGTIEYSVLFFKISDDGEKFLYKLNTLPTTSMILNSLYVTPEDLDGETVLEESLYKTLLDRIAAAVADDVYWVEIK